MPQCTTRQCFAGEDGDGIRLDINGAIQDDPVWHSSDETVFRAIVSNSGMRGLIVAVAPSRVDTLGIFVPTRVVVQAIAAPTPGDNTRVVLRKIFDNLVCVLDDRDRPPATQIDAHLGEPIERP